MLRIVLATILSLGISLSAIAQKNPAERNKSKVPRLVQKPTADEPFRFILWEKQSDLRRRAGNPQQYFVPAAQKLIAPADLRYYEDTYKKVDDVFYRQTPVGRVRILIAYATDESESRLSPEIRVEKVHFFFDKDVALRRALAAVRELRELCAGGCIMNGFSSTVVAQPASPSEAQVLLAHKMKPHWRGQDMSDATPGAEVFYVDSPYPIDFEHSPVERIDYTLTSNAGREHYTLAIVNKQPTVLDVWHPKINDFQVATK
jgi:hypothetical protein